MKSCGRLLFAGWLTLVCALILFSAQSIQAQEDAPKPAAEVKATSPTQAQPASRLKLSGHVEMGATYNPDNPKDNINFGRLFDDKANSFLLNQILLTAERPLDTTAKSFDWGFKLQVMYGSDARYTHSFGLLDNVDDDRNQPDLVEAYLNTHFPILTPGGVDVKVGKFVTMEGAEVIDSTGNFFYSHSYIFNFGIPLTHSGVMATTHLNKYLDLYTGLTRGVNASVRDNNDVMAFHGGVGLNLLDGKIVTLASTHIGPENPDDNDNYRFLNDITTTIKLTEKLTSITDLNYTHDEVQGGVDCYGAAQYFTYAIKDWISAGVRAEIFRDPQGFYVAAFPENDGFIDFQEGKPTQVIPGGKTTYGELTFGLNIKPVKHVLLRPEVRFDRALNGDTKPFNDNDRNMVTAALSVMVLF